MLRPSLASKKEFPLLRDVFGAGIRPEDELFVPVCSLRRAAPKKALLSACY